MKNIYDIFKKQFGAEKSTLNDINEGDLWNSIVDELGTENSVPAAPIVRPTRYKWLLWTIPVVILIAGGYFLGYQNGATLVVQEQTDQRESEDSQIVSTELDQINVIQTEGDDLISLDLSSVVEDEPSSNVSQGHRASKPNMSSKNNKAKKSKSIAQSKSNEVEVVGRKDMTIESDATVSKPKRRNSNTSAEALGDVDRTIVVDNANIAETSAPMNTEVEGLSQLPEAKASEIIETENSKRAENEGDPMLAEKIEPEVSFPEDSEKETKAVDGKIDITETFVEETNKAVDANSAEIELNEERDEEKVKSPQETKIIEKPAISEEENKVLKEDEVDEMTAPVISEISKLDQKALEWFASIHGGINAFFMDFRGTDAPLTDLKNSTESKSLGSSYGLSLEANYLKKWLFSVQVNTNSYNSIYRSVATTITITEKDKLTGILINGQSNDVIQEYLVDTSYTINSQSKTIHNNNYKAISIPLSIGIQKRYRTVEYGVMGGAVFSYRMNQSGKTLNADQELTSFDDSQDVLFSKTNVGFSVAPFANFSLTRKLALKAEYRLAYFTNDPFGTGELNLDKYLNTLNVGLRYKF